MREDWLRWGNLNTKLFHSKASHRRKRNNLKGIFDVAGIWANEASDVGRVATGYFTKLFQSSGLMVEAIKKNLEDMNSGISESQRAKLERSFSKAEIEMALKGMNPNKAPGSDGAHALFYQNY